MADATKNDLLELDYKTTFDAWRQLVDIRFKLLALIPVASVVGVSQDIPSGACAAALIFVIGLAVYEIRNTQVHDALGKRLMDLERMLGDGNADGDQRGFGPFSTRPQASLHAFGVLRIWHNRSIGIVYGTSAAAWFWRFVTSWQLDWPFVLRGQIWSTIATLIVGAVIYREIVRLSNVPP
ncbi:hypothetical protein [Sphaerisporangium flaviroseum]